MALTIAIGAFVFVLAWDNLPPLDALTDYRPKIPLRIYTTEGTLIGEFGEERRAVVQISDVPDVLKQAIIAAEDERFYQHTGVDLIGVIRAAISNVLSGGRKQGASTITMQLARNLFLSSERTFTRKIYEALLAYKIESSLTKDQILETYINQIYLGQRAYGFASAAQTYYGKSVRDITVGEAAMLAGLPKAPSSFNPVVNPKRAHQRQQYVLRRMHEIGALTESQLAEAQKVSSVQVVRREATEFPIHAEYAAEMVRQALFERYPDEIYTRGFRVYTTISRADQEAAHGALRKGVLEYDRRHGYRGPEAYVTLPANAPDEAIEDALQDSIDNDDLLAAVVLEASAKQVKVYRRGGELTIPEAGLRFVSRMLGTQVAPDKRIMRGAVVRVQRDEKGNWSITQLPDVASAFVSMDPRDGAIRALVGGFDFTRNKYNRVTQAWRQPGSSFKPFIYSAALDRGFTPATIVNDDAVVVDAALTGGQTWEPKNYDGKFEGPMRLRTALAKSKNMVSIRVLQAIGTRYAQEFVGRFGFDADKHPPYLTMALGAGSVTPMQMARGYAVFANGGFRVDPYLITKIVDDRGNLLAEAQPAKAAVDAPRVLDSRNAFIMDTMLRDVIRVGTAVRANVLGRNDLSGKTGTTNDYNDAWFVGYQQSLVAAAWLGFDTPKRLGNNETGALAALPIWINYMSRVLKNVPQSPILPPDSVVTIRVDPETGLADPDGKLTEFFYRGAPLPALSVDPPAAEDPARPERRVF
ncbi:MAG: penicillin-binding protein 1A [Burkholderiales bacterium]